MCVCDGGDGRRGGGARNCMRGKKNSRNGEGSIFEDGIRAPLIVQRGSNERRTPYRSMLAGVKEGGCISREIKQQVSAVKTVSHMS